MGEWAFTRIAGIGERVRRIELVAVLHPDLAHATAGGDDQIDHQRQLGADLLLQGTDRRRMPGERPVMGAEQHDDPASFAGGEVAQGRGEARMRPERPAGIVVVLDEELEHVAAQHHDARPVEAVDQPGQVSGHDLRGLICVLTEMEIAHHHDTSAGRNDHIEEVWHQLLRQLRHAPHATRRPPG